LGELLHLLIYIDFISHQVQQIRQRQTDKTHKVKLYTHNNN